MTFDLVLWFWVVKVIWPFRNGLSTVLDSIDKDKQTLLVRPTWNIMTRKKVKGLEWNTTRGRYATYSIGGDEKSNRFSEMQNHGCKGWQFC